MDIKNDKEAYRLSVKLALADLPNEERYKMALDVAMYYAFKEGFSKNIKTLKPNLSYKESSNKIIQEMLRSINNE